MELTKTQENILSTAKENLEKDAQENMLNSMEWNETDWLTHRDGNILTSIRQWDNGYHLSKTDWDYIKMVLEKHK